MTKTTAIQLTKPIENVNGIIKEIIFKEPTFRDFIKFGMPVILANSPDGTSYEVTDKEALQGYIESCLVKPSDFLVLNQCNLADALSIKSEFIRFFIEASQGAAPKNDLTPAQ